ncbi:uncharacterized protein LOC112506986 isoform X2 [Cynara cardunculus var. scolymus]|uniref:uncharacterized protein LOC112506986 isoform X2 n=1 Tax=Cynara cardunculus var. scolymus TaxID=59895 RepID=UPI000D630F22|nr:uncharacterized protein LOC112506986 isoform X2 [Cynara cardunculus var. scolymus]
MVSLLEDYRRGRGGSALKAGLMRFMVAIVCERGKGTGNCICARGMVTGNGTCARRNGSRKCCLTIKKPISREESGVVEGGERDEQVTGPMNPWLLTRFTIGEENGWAFKRRTNHSSRLEECLFAEIMDAYRKRGTARKKREVLHGLASTNRSYAHFRWW